MKRVNYSNGDPMMVDHGFIPASDRYAKRGLRIMQMLALISVLSVILAALLLFSVS